MADQICRIDCRARSRQWPQAHRFIRRAGLRLLRDDMNQAGGDGQC